MYNLVTYLFNLFIIIPITQLCLNLFGYFPFRGPFSYFLQVFTKLSFIYLCSTFTDEMWRNKNNDKIQEMCVIMSKETFTSWIFIHENKNITRNELEMTLRTGFCILWVPFNQFYFIIYLRYVMRCIVIRVSDTRLECLGSVKVFANLTFFPIGSFNWECSNKPVNRIEETI